MSSCFLLQLKDDSISGIYDTLKQCAQISQSAGGIGLSVHNLRAKGSYIKGTNGTSNGIVPMLRVFNDTARYVDQGGGKRKGSFAIYLEPWHADVFDFLELKKNHGKEEMRARDLFYAMWIPDLFMKRVEANGEWTLMCPNECPGLCDTWGEEFEALYERYEPKARAAAPSRRRTSGSASSRARSRPARPTSSSRTRPTARATSRTWAPSRAATSARRSSSTPAPTRWPCATWAPSRCPSSWTRALRPPEALRGHLRADQEPQPGHRPQLLPDPRGAPQQHAPPPHRHRRAGPGRRLHPHAHPFDSVEAKVLNREIFETIYYAALTASKDLAKAEGPYETYAGSPVSKGILQFDMWGVKPSDRWEWDILRDEIKKHGVRNSLLLAPMPTASTAQILGNNECFEPYTSNLYTRACSAASSSW
jgi:ribonucleotide reductase alpha subunit